MTVPRPDAILHLSVGDVSVVLDAGAAQLPAIVHWGALLPHLDERSARSLVAAAVPALGSNNSVVPPRVGLLPSHHTGWTGRPGVSGSFDGAGWSPRFVVDRISVDGEPVSGFHSLGAAAVVFDAHDARSPLALTLVFELLESGLIRCRARLSNGADAPYTLDDISIAFAVPAEACELLDFTGEHNLERVPERMPWRAGLHMRENRRGRTAADSAFVLHAGTPGFGFSSGEIWAVHTAWSGNHRHVAERVYTGEQLLGGGELLLPGEIRLGRGDGYETPWVYGSHGVGLDQVARRFHRHVRARDRAVSAARPVTMNVWEAVYFDHDIRRLTALADRAAQVGIERYVLDDGWFGARRDDHAGLGDWVVASDVWPDGLHPLVDHVRRLGMQFGLWVEPEMINLDSELARAHPEWIMSAADAELPVESRNQQVLDIAIPGAYAHVRDQLCALLDEYPIDYLKWDHNRDLVDAGDRTRAGRPAVHAQTLAFYRLLDEMRSRYPHLEIESCSSGGGRVDLGVLEHVDRVWVSDNIDPHDRQRMLRWTGQLLPPEYLGSHIASRTSHATGRTHALGFRAATAIFGHLGVEWDLTAASEDEVTELAAWIAFYKERRDLLLGGEVVRMDGTDPDILSHGVVAADGREAIYAIVALDTMIPDPPSRLKLRGLAPGARYLVRPLFVGAAPSGLVAPEWWGEAGRARSGGEYAGDVFTSETLRHVGVASPRIRPDQALLYHVIQV